LSAGYAGGCEGEKLLNARNFPAQRYEVARPDRQVSAASFRTAWHRKKVAPAWSGLAGALGRLNFLTVWLGVAPRGRSHKPNRGGTRL